MKITTLVAIILFHCTIANAATSVTQHGVTWTFDSDKAVGQFINGDYYVIGTTNITGISPGYTSSPRAMNGSMINPLRFPQGYDAGVNSGGEYSSARNVGIGISESTPLVLTAGQSLVSTISNNPAQYKNEYINSVAVLTCLASAPPANTFRPGLSGSTKTLHNMSSVNLSLLKKLAVPSGQTVTASTLTTYAGYFQMAWLSHNDDYQVEEIHPSASGLDEYYYSETFSEAALMLHLDFTDNEKRALLINFIQLGIDLYSFLEGGEIGWKPNGGHGNGRKWPILFAGLMLDYAPMKNIGQVSGDYLYSGSYGPGNLPPDYKSFTEDGQTFYVKQYDIDQTTATWISDSWRNTGYLSYDKDTNIFVHYTSAGGTVGPWNPDTRNDSKDGASPYDGIVYCRPYTTTMLNMPEWSVRHSTYPTYSDSDWNPNGYRTIGSGAVTWAGTSVAARIMGAKTLWNNNAFFDYVDRYVAVSRGQSDPFGYTVTNETAVSPISGLIGAMYDTYRNYSPGTKYKNVKSITQDQQ